MKIPAKGVRWGGRRSAAAAAAGFAAGTVMFGPLGQSYGEGVLCRSVLTLAGVEQSAPSFGNLAFCWDMAFMEHLERFVAVYGPAATNDFIQTFDYGGAWISQGRPFGAASGWSSVDYSPPQGRVVAAGSGVKPLVWSDTGLAWTPCTLNGGAIPDSERAYTVHWSGQLGKWCALSSDTVGFLNDVYWLQSVDGKDWTDDLLPGALGLHQSSGIAEGNGVILSVGFEDIGNTNQCLRSVDGGATWAAVAMPAGPGPNCVAFGNNLFVTTRNGAAGALNSVVSDDAGLTWNAYAIPKTHAADATNKGASFVLFDDTNAIFVAGGAPGYNDGVYHPTYNSVLTGANGQDFVRHVLTVDNAFCGAAVVP